MSFDNRSDNNAALISEKGFEFLPAGRSGSPLLGGDGSSLLAIKFSSSRLVPGDAVMLGLLTNEKNEPGFRTLAMTHICSPRYGCGARWLDDERKKRIIYNDLRGKNYDPCSVILDIEKSKEIMVVRGHVQDISPDGSFGIMLEYSFKRKLSPGKPAISRLDIKSGDISDIISCEDITGFREEEYKGFSQHSVSGIRISPDGKNILFIHEMASKNEKRSRLLVADVNGRITKELGCGLNVKSAVWSSSGEVMGCFAEKDGCDHFYSIDLFDNIPHMMWHELKNAKECFPLAEEGFFIGEAYNDKKKQRGLYLLTKKDKRSRLLAASKPDIREPQGDFYPVTADDGSFVIYQAEHKKRRALFKLTLQRPDLERYDTAAEKNHSVTILLATYNGARFLKQQLDSLLAQKGVRVNILARDDGSTDETKSILEDYQSRGLLKWYTGEHMNVQKGYLDLMKNAPRSDYYAFCDQDDVWDDDKLLAAVTELDDMDNSKPAMYYCGQKLVDENLKLLSVHSVHTQRNDHTNFFFSNVAGCTEVFNQRLLDEINSAQPEFIHSHDNWSLKVCLAMGGSFVTDPVSRISYRQHGGNVVGLNVGIKGRYKQVQRYMSIKLKKQCENLLACYGDRMIPEYREIAEDICNYDSSFKSRRMLLKKHDVDFRSRSFNYVIKLKVMLKKL